MPHVPEIRVRPCNARAIDPRGDYVLYWMIAARRVRYNFGLQRAADRAAELGKPLLVFEAIRAGYRWASDRIHRFVLEGMADNEARLGDGAALYYPYVEPEAGADKGLLEALAARAAVVVTDEFPAFFLPRMVAAAAARCPVLMEQVDSNGLLPLHAPDKVFTTARALRYFLQKHLPDHLHHAPRPDPLKGIQIPRLRAVPRAITGRWPRASAKLLAGSAAELASIRIDRTVGAVATKGGARAGEAALTRFLRRNIARYAEERSDPDAGVASGLSPYLHFGHLSAHEVFARLMRHDEWSPSDITGHVRGLREGFWGASREVEAFLDELVTWRELGYNMCAGATDYDKFSSLPDWAKKTLQKHAEDPRPHLYSRADLEAARTHDPLWNAAQRELLGEGRIHNYLRMLWGKKVLEWSRSPEEALETLIELNNKYAIDGRDPNSYSGILWVFGRYDRPWPPERPIFGQVRYMSSESTRRKLKLSGYLAAHGGADAAARMSR